MPQGTVQCHSPCLRLCHLVSHLIKILKLWLQIWLFHKWSQQKMHWPHEPDPMRFEFKISSLRICLAVVVKNPPANAGDISDAGLIPGLGRYSGGRHDNSLQYSCLENPWTEEPSGHDWSNWARSFAKLCPTVCNPMDCSTPGFPVLHYLPEFA